MSRERSKKLWKEAREVIPGGVNSPVRAYSAVGEEPLFMAKGEGSKVYDVDGNCYIDYLCSWGPLILGHSHPRVVQVIKEVAELSTSFGAGTEAEVRFAQLIVKAVPSIEKVRLVNSGTEAVMSAVRLARGYSRRDKIVKFEGCYHGHSDSLLVRAGSGLATFGVPDSAGVPEALARETLTLPYNDIDAFNRTVKRYHKDIACVIIEPVAGNMGVVPLMENFLADIREITLKYRIVLIFDEVITGFRVHYGGAQSLYKVRPDMTILGKIIGGGLPIGAFGGRAEIMDYLVPGGSVYQAGTLSGNPLAVNVGIVMLELLKQGNFYEKLEEKARVLTDGLKSAANSNNIKICINRVGSMFSLFFTDSIVSDYKSAKTSDTKRFAGYFHNMLRRGIYLAPSAFESSFLSDAHTDKDIERTIKSAYEAMKGI